MISKMTFYSNIYNFIVNQDCIVVFQNISNNVPQSKYIEFTSENLGNNYPKLLRRRLFASCMITL